MFSDFETRSNPLFNSGSGDMNEAAPRRIKSTDNSSQNSLFRLFPTIPAHSFLRSKNILMRAPGPEKGTIRGLIVCFWFRVQTWSNCNPDLSLFLRFSPFFLFFSPCHTHIHTHIGPPRRAMEPLADYHHVLV